MTKKQLEDMLTREKAKVFTLEVELVQIKTKLADVESVVAWKESCRESDRRDAVVMITERNLLREILNSFFDSLIAKR